MQEDIDPIHLLLVNNWKDMAARKRGESLKQKKITAYFNFFFKFHETCNDISKQYIFVMLIYLILRYDYFKVSEIRAISELRAPSGPKPPG